MDEKAHTGPHPSRSQLDMPEKETRAAAPLPPNPARENEDGSSNSTTLTTTPLVPAQDHVTAIHRFSSIARRDGRHLAEPPRLPFNLREHKVSLAIFTFMALAECCFVPIAFYYGFSQGTSLRSGRCLIAHVRQGSELSDLGRNLFCNHNESVRIREWIRVWHSGMAPSHGDGRIPTALW